MIYFLVPVYNEAANITSLFDQLTAWQAENADQTSHFVFSDDGSVDNSVALIAATFANHQHTILGDGINRGPGAAFNRGFEWILENASAGDTVVTLEADSTSDLGILPVMLMLNAAGFDLVLASVYAQGGGFEQTNLIRRFISAVANVMFRFLFDVQVLTLSSFYRVYDIALLRKVRDRYGSLITERGFVCMLEILVRSIRCDARIIEVPMRLHSSRRKGPSNMKVFRTTMQYLRFFARKNS